MACMEELAAAMLHYIASHTGQNPYATPIANVLVMRSDHPKPPVHILYRPAMCIVAQGAKWATFGGTRLEYRAGEALVVGIDAPSVGRVTEASPDRPCLVLAFELDPAMMRSVASEMSAPPLVASETGRGVFVTDFHGPLSDCALRLVRLLATPEAIPTLHPLIMREICYWLLSGPHGGEIARIMLATSPTQSLINALRHLRERFSEVVRVEDLAQVAGLSASAFHRQFKTLTSLSPLQYQKQLRLLEARRLLIVSGVGAEAAAFKVGYESPSQFSREYARMFGAPPRRDLKTLEQRLDGHGRREIASEAA